MVVSAGASLASFQTNSLTQLLANKLVMQMDLIIEKCSKMLQAHLIASYKDSLTKKRDNFFIAFVAYAHLCLKKELGFSFVRCNI